MLISFFILTFIVKETEFEFFFCEYSPLPLYNQLDLFGCISEEILRVFVSQVTCVVVVDFGDYVSADQLLTSGSAWRHLEIINYD